MKKFFCFTLLIIISIFSLPAIGISAPGALHLVAGPGFWANDFPDRFIFLEHLYYYHASKEFDGDGHTKDIKDTNIVLSIHRFIKPWHFGENDKFQILTEGILMQYDYFNIHNDGKNSKTAMANPLLLSRLGWRNTENTTHLSIACAWQIPLGDEDLVKALNAGNGGNNHAIIPFATLEQRWNNFWLDASTAYWHNFEDLDSKAQVQDYYEFNLALSYHFKKFKIPFLLYAQGDYVKYFAGDDIHGKDLHNKGHNFAAGPGIRFIFSPKVAVDVKYTRDIDGKNTLRGNSMNAFLEFIF
jgi:hypothetical protein